MPPATRTVVGDAERGGSIDILGYIATMFEGSRHTHTGSTDILCDGTTTLDNY